MSVADTKALRDGVTALERLDEAPRRLTPTERLHELAMTYASRPSTAPEHSLNLIRNAKGVTQIDLTVRSYDLAELLAKGTEAFDGLRARYPLPSGYVGAEGEPAPGGAK